VVLKIATKDYDSAERGGDDGIRRKPLLEHVAQGD
jgi:hypothetical protein